MRVRGRTALPLTAVAGFAQATTTITNDASILKEKNGIFGAATANASAYATTSSGGSAFGGTAIAGVVISNSGTILDALNAGPDFDDGGGIKGRSSATANATGFTAVGGTASATTTIVNAPAITVELTAITGSATANANAYGVDVKGSSATGGTAVAVTVISNGTADALSSHSGSGIDGSSNASANAGTYSTRSYTATGGFATAGTQISNSSSIKSNDDAIVGNATANANAYGSNTFTPFTPIVQAQTTTYTYGACDDDPIFTCKTGTNAGHAYTAGTNFSSGSATGGTALAGVLITNAGTLTSNSEGIDGSASAAGQCVGLYSLWRHGERQHGHH